MQFPGYWVSVESNKATLLRITFDETELDPATNWKQAWQNQDAASSTKGFVELSSALIYIANVLALGSNQTLSQEQLNLAASFIPTWMGEQCTIHALSELFENH
jgi:hypothetical protein